MLTPFHLAIPVHDLEQARRFYGQVLGCPEGRSDTRWIDFDLFGHQLVVHLADHAKPAPPQDHNAVDGHEVPVPHFGVVLGWDDFDALVARLNAHQVSFVIAPYLRFAGLPGEQKTMFFYDPSGNAVEFKAFKDLGQLFAK